VARLKLIYTKIRTQSVICFCNLLRRHPHFNFRLNILQIILPRISSHDDYIRKEVTKLLFDLLAHQDQGILDFKVEVLKELNKVIKQKPHE